MVVENKTNDKIEKMFKYCNIQKKFIPYDKETVIDKLEENLDTILKYWTNCEENKESLFNHNSYLPTRDYIRSRIENIYNLLSSLSFNNVLPWEEFNEYTKDYNEIKKEFEKESAPSNEEEWESHLLKLSCFVDTILALSVFDTKENSDEEENYEEEEIDEMDLPEEEEFIIPDNISIYNINNECKKRKAM